MPKQFTLRAVAMRFGPQKSGRVFDQMTVAHVFQLISQRPAPVNERDRHVRLARRALGGALAAIALARVAACRGGALSPDETSATQATETADRCGRSNPPITCLFREKPASPLSGGASER